MSKNEKIFSYTVSVISIVAAFLIIGRDAIFGDKSLAEIDFSIFFIILVPVVVANIFMLTRLNKKNEE